MRQRLLVTVVFLLGAGACPKPVEAAHVRHRPWGSGPHKTRLPLVHHHSKTVVQYAHPTTRPKDAVTPVAQASDVQKPTYSDLDLRKPDAGAEIAQQALAYEGSNYKFGGVSTKGMDCSGLVARIYADLKMHRVPRVSSALYKSGRPVEMEALRPGDLVFFKNTYKRGISHVGVYAGNNKFVHAANRRHGVIVTSMADPYYQLHFAGARRLY